jgi:hypothetical protein
VAGVVGDRYELLEVLGHGGDTEVVRAIDRRHDRLVALKVRRLAADEAREPLLAEGRTLLELRRIMRSPSYATTSSSTTATCSSWTGSTERTSSESFANASTTRDGLPRARAGPAHAGAIHRRTDRAGWCFGRRRRPG